MFIICKFSSHPPFLDELYITNTTPLDLLPISNTQKTLLHDHSTSLCDTCKLWMWKLVRMFSNFCGCIFHNRRMILIPSLSSLIITSSFMETKEKNKGGSRGLIYTTLSGTMRLSLIFSHTKQVALFQKKRKRAKTKLPESSSSWPRDVGHIYFETLSQKCNSSTVIPDGTEPIPYFKSPKLFHLPV